MLRCLICLITSIIYYFISANADSHIDLTLDLIKVYSRGFYFNSCAPIIMIIDKNVICHVIS